MNMALNGGNTPNRDSCDRYTQRFSRELVLGKDREHLSQLSFEPTTDVTTDEQGHRWPTTGYLCHVCQMPLHPVLASIGTHPGCDPAANDLEEQTQ